MKQDNSPQELHANHPDILSNQGADKVTRTQTIQKHPNICTIHNSAISFQKKMLTKKLFLHNNTPYRHTKNSTQKFLISPDHSTLILQNFQNKQYKTLSKIQKENLQKDQKKRRPSQ